MRYNLILALLLISITNGIIAQSDKNYDIIVAADGSGDYSSVQEALNHCRPFMTKEKVIFIKDGVYKEKVLVYAYLTHIRIVGESKEHTIITYSDHANMEGIGTFNSYTLKVAGMDIVIENLTIENAAGPVGQAVALHVEGDHFKISNCKILGNQDTLYAAGLSSRHFYNNCYIEGTTDFIFGAATAVFDSCEIFSKKNSYITAASTLEENRFGYVFRNCILTAKDDVDEVYLGRPWRNYAKVVFLNCEMGDHILPEGWHNWNDPEREKTAFYAEFNSKGAGGKIKNRVSWSHQLSENEATKYTLDNIFNNTNSWDVKK